MNHLIEPLFEVFRDLAIRPATDDSVWHVQDPDLIGMEVELQVLLYGLVLLTKPEVVVETGCYRGGTSEVLAAAMRANGKGELHITDIKMDYLRQAAVRARRYLEMEQVWLHGGDEENRVVRNDIQEALRRADIAVIDSSFESRAMEIDYLKDGAIAVVHDTRAKADLGQLVESKFPRRIFFGSVKGGHLIQV